MYLCFLKTVIDACLVFIWAVGVLLRFVCFASAWLGGHVFFVWDLCNASVPMLCFGRVYFVEVRFAFFARCLSRRVAFGLVFVFHSLAFVISKTG